MYCPWDETDTLEQWTYLWERVCTCICSTCKYIQGNPWYNGMGQTLWKVDVYVVHANTFLRIPMLSHGIYMGWDSGHIWKVYMLVYIVYMLVHSYGVLH